MRFNGTGTGAGGVGPSVGEAVLTHEGRGVVVAIDYEARSFVVRMRATELSEQRVYPLEIYEQQRGDSFVRCAWDCGIHSHAMQCYLEAGHAGPHLFKLK